jgi:hypothetical protein
MTNDDIIRMAREAGIDWHQHWDIGADTNRLERFAELVAAFERSECVDIVIDNSDMDGICCTDDVLEAIRARGEK